MVIVENPGIWAGERDPPDQPPDYDLPDLRNKQ